MKNFPGGMQNFLRQAQQMQNKMGKLQEELAKQTTEASTGGGAVTVVAFGNQTLSSVKIGKEIMESGDVEMLQDLVLSAANEALKKAKEMSEAEMQKVTGGLSIPGLF